MMSRSVIPTTTFGYRYTFPPTWLVDLQKEPSPSRMPANPAMSTPEARGKIRNHIRDGRVETCDVAHSGVIRIGERSTRRSHRDHDQPGRNAGLLPVLPQRLVWVDVAVPGLPIRVDHER